MKKEKIANILTSNGVLVGVAITVGVLGGTHIGIKHNQIKNDIIIQERNEIIEQKEQEIIQLNESIVQLRSKEIKLNDANEDLKTRLSKLSEENEKINIEMKSIENENDLLKDMIGLKKNDNESINARKVWIEVSAYYHGDPGVGDITASGSYVKVGDIAAPPEIPFGTKVIIDGFDMTYTVTDRGGYIQTVYNENGEPVYRVDIYVNSYAEACMIGRRTVPGYFIYE